jgi:hypothetical protein
MHLLVFDPSRFRALLGEPSVYERVLRAVVSRLRALETRDRVAA